MITNSYFPDSEPMLSLEHFYGPQKHLVKKCLVILSYQIYQHLMEEFPYEIVDKVDSCNGSLPIHTFDYQGETYAYYLSPIGSTLAGETLAEVNWKTGAEHYIMFGSCGSLDGPITQGKFIVPTHAYRGEGLSYYYAPAQDYITIKNANKVRTFFESQAIPHVSGRVWTTDSMLRETKALVQARKSEGCIAVEMELAGVQAVCDFYGLELYNFLASGDVLDEAGYCSDGLHDANHHVDKLGLALEFLRTSVEVD